MKKKYLIPILTFITLILEFLPYGVVLNFANPEGEPFRRTYSYFSLTPYGYAVFGPFLAAILTSVLLILSVVFYFKSTEKLLRSIKIIAFLALICSLSPLLYGFSYFSIIGAFVSVFLFLICLSASLTK